MAQHLCYRLYPGTKTTLSVTPYSDKDCIIGLAVVPQRRYFLPLYHVADHIVLAPRQKRNLETFRETLRFINTLWKIGFTTQCKNNHVRRCHCSGLESGASSGVSDCITSLYQCLRHDVHDSSRDNTAIVGFRICGHYWRGQCHREVRRGLSNTGYLKSLISIIRAVKRGDLP